MNNPLHHTPSQISKTVWVFSLNVPENQLKPWVHEAFPEDEDAHTIWPLRDALGLDHLDSDFTEVFPASNIKEYGLANYLTEANGFAEESVAPDKRKLDALTGPVALVYSEALGGQDVTLKPDAPLIFIGRYETRPDLRMSSPIQTDSATGQLAPDAPAPESARMPLWPMLLFVALVVGGILLLWGAK